ncbi:transcriptional regulator with XRE-family HTH domain [Lederbergia galactosidilyticus]|nr:transcriptional regulator with XRE-family HTH domain [Lederbergia galactosidilytica]
MDMFSKRLKLLRTNKKLTQQNMANFLGITRQGYAKYETGQSEPDNETIKKLADFFDVSTDYLLGRTDKPNEEKTAEEIYEDPDFQYAMRSAQGLSEESKQKVFDFIEMMKEVEKARNKSKPKKNK